MAFVCKYCGASFLYEDRLKMHISFKHPEAEATQSPKTETLEDFVKQNLNDENVIFKAVTKFDVKPSEVQTLIDKIKAENNKPVNKGEADKKEDEKSAKEVESNISPPLVKFKKFRIARHSDEKKIRIELAGEEYYEYVLADFSPEMIKELGEDVVNSIYNFLKKHEGEGFKIIRMGDD